MRTIVLSLAVLVGLVGFGFSQDQSDDSTPRYKHFRPAHEHHYGITPYNGFHYRMPNQGFGYYTPPSLAPDNPLPFGYTPHNSFHYRPTGQYNFYDYNATGR